MKKDWATQEKVDKGCFDVAEENGLTPAEVTAYQVGKHLGCCANTSLIAKVQNWKNRQMQQDVGIMPFADGVFQSQLRDILAAGIEAQAKLVSDTLEGRQRESNRNVSAAIASHNQTIASLNEDYAVLFEHAQDVEAELEKALKVAEKRASSLNKAEATILQQKGEIAALERLVNMASANPVTRAAQAAANETKAESEENAAITTSAQQIDEGQVPSAADDSNIAAVKDDESDPVIVAANTPEPPTVREEGEDGDPDADALSCAEKVIGPSADDTMRDALSSETVAEAVNKPPISGADTSAPKACGLIRTTANLSAPSEMNKKPGPD